MGRPRDRRRPSASFLAAGAALLALLLPGAVGAAWTTNLVTLDDGICGTNLQIGSDKTASSSATPSFFLRGDGGLSSYSVSIDGASIGTFNSLGNGVVCIRAPVTLADGAHVLTGTELKPHAGWVVTPFAFTVDTVSPAAPSEPVLSAYKDSGVLGDGITKFRSVNVTGTAGPNEPVQVLSNGVAVVGGAKADASGRWSATTVTFLDGTYTLEARALDAAGNRSALSGGMRLTIDGVAPATPAAPALETLEDGEPTTGPVVTGTAPLGATTVRVFGDGVQVGAAVPGRARTWRLALPSLQPGPHAIAVAASDAADNVSSLSAPLIVTVESPEPPPPDTTPPPEESRPAPPEPTRPPAPRTAPPPRVVSSSPRAHSP
jgi:hypothetical protein